MVGALFYLSIVNMQQDPVMLSHSGRYVVEKETAVLICKNHVACWRIKVQESFCVCAQPMRNNVTL